MICQLICRFLPPLKPAYHPRALNCRLDLRVRPPVTRELCSAVSIEGLACLKVSGAEKTFCNSLGECEGV